VCCSFTVEEGVALLGSHAILEIQGCRTGPREQDVCNPDNGSCADKLRMFQWRNHFYQVGRGLNNGWRSV
jgi:hypothetical protein